MHAVLSAMEEVLELGVLGLVLSPETNDGLELRDYNC